MASKCVYCNNEIHEPHAVVVGKEKDALTCCSETCVKKVLAFYRFFDRTKVFFFIGIAVSMILLFVSVFYLTVRQMLVGSIWMGASLALLGLIIVLFPFATPQTFNALGIRKTVWITRLIGLCVIALGPLLAYFVRT